MTRYILIASGREVDEKWGNHLGLPKHLAPINGEPLIHRTVRQLLERGQTDIWIAGLYEVPGATSYIPNPPQVFDVDIDFWSSREKWHPLDRTVILYGDVVWSEQAMDALPRVDDGTYRLWCRPWPSIKHFYRYGEVFAMSIPPERHADLDWVTSRLVGYYHAGLIFRVGSWELTRYMAEVPTDRLQFHDFGLFNQVIVDDETNDIDFPDDYYLVTTAFEVK